MIFSVVAAVVLLLACYLIYYRSCVAVYPEVFCSDPEWRNLLKQYCPVLFTRFYPIIWLPSGSMQTIVRSQLQTYPNHPRRRETVWLNDGGYICLDWYNEGSSVQPTVIMLPGITGSSDENYVRHWVDDMVKQEYRCIVYINRGCGNIKLANTKLYCGTETEDLVEVLTHIRTSIPDSPLLGLATSSGCYRWIKYLSYCKKSNQASVLKAILLFSPMWDMNETQAILKQTFLNRYILARYMVSKYTGILKENCKLYEEAMLKGELEFDYNQALKSTCLESLSESMLIPMFGYSSFEEYMTDWSARYILDGITIPVVVVSALDDPLCSPSSIPIEEVKKNPNLMLVIFKRGGHNGFLNIFSPFGKNLMDKILVQFASTIFEQS